jgi:hypothetical protein
MVQSAQDRSEDPELRERLLNMAREWMTAAMDGEQMPKPKAGPVLVFLARRGAQVARASSRDKVRAMSKHPWARCLYSSALARDTN